MLPLLGNTIIVRRLTGVVVVLLRQFVLGFVILEAVLPVAGIKPVVRLPEEPRLGIG